MATMCIVNMVENKILYYIVNIRHCILLEYFFVKYISFALAIPWIYNIWRLCESMKSVIKLIYQYMKVNANIYELLFSDLSKYCNASAFVWINHVWRCCT